MLLTSGLAVTTRRAASAASRVKSSRACPSAAWGRRHTSRIATEVARKTLRSNQGDAFRCKPQTRCSKEPSGVAPGGEFLTGAVTSVANLLASRLKCSTVSSDE